MTPDRAVGTSWKMMHHYGPGPRPGVVVLAVAIACEDGSDGGDVDMNADVDVELDMFEVSPEVAVEDSPETTVEEGMLLFEPIFPTVPPTAPPTTAPRTTMATMKMVILPLRVRQKDWAGREVYEAFPGIIFSCVTELLSTSVSLGSVCGLSGWVDAGRVGRSSSKSTL